MNKTLPVAAALLLAIGVASDAGAATKQVTASTNDRAQSSAVFTAGYELALDFTPDVEDWLDRSQVTGCELWEAGGYVCRLAGSWSDTGAPLVGTLRDPQTGLGGELKARCSISGYSYVDFAIQPPDAEGRPPMVTLTDVGGNADVDCAWRARMRDGQGSMLTGRATASGLLSAAQPGTALARLGGEVRFDAAAGTGAFAGYSGTGVTEASVVFSMLGPENALPIDFRMVAFGAERSIRTARHTATGRIDFELRRSGPGLRLSAPRRVSKHGIKRSIVGATLPGARCHFTARRAGARLSLGSASADRDGFVRVSAKRAASLKAGSWQVAAVCEAGMARVADRVRVTVG